MVLPFRPRPCQREPDYILSDSIFTKLYFVLTIFLPDYITVVLYFVRLYSVRLYFVRHTISIRSKRGASVKERNPDFLLWHQQRAISSLPACLP